MIMYCEKLFVYNMFDWEVLLCVFFDIFLLSYVVFIFDGVCLIVGMVEGFVYVIEFMSLMSIKVLYYFFS